MLSFKVNKENGNVDKFDTHEKNLMPPHEEAEPAVIGSAVVPGESTYAEIGKKFDKGKLDWTLMPFSALEDAVRVLMFGAKKYDRENWKLVADGERRYKAAGMRHMIASMSGEEFDPETGIRHTAHAMVNLLFAEWLRQQREGK